MSVMAQGDAHTEQVLHWLHSCWHPLFSLYHSFEKLWRNWKMLCLLQFFGTSADGGTAVTCFLIILSSHMQLMLPLLASIQRGRHSLHVVCGLSILWHKGAHICLYVAFSWFCAFLHFMFVWVGVKSVLCCSYLLPFELLCCWLHTDSSWQISMPLL